MAGKKNSSPTSGELGEILGRFSDAKAVIETAVQVMERCDYPPEVVTARQGLRMLSGVYDELDSAIMRLPD